MQHRPRSFVPSKTACGFTIKKWLRETRPAVSIANERGRTAIATHPRAFVPVLIISYSLCISMQSRASYSISPYCIPACRTEPARARTVIAPALRHEVGARPKRIDRYLKTDPPTGYNPSRSAQCCNTRPVAALDSREVHGRRARRDHHRVVDRRGPFRKVSQARRRTKRDAKRRDRCAFASYSI